MDNVRTGNAERVVRTNIGPIAFSIIFNASFVSSNTEQHNERHQHATYELHINEEGAGAVLMDDSEHRFIENSFFVIKPGIYHRIIGSPSNPMKRYCFRFEFDIEEKLCGGYSDEEVKCFVYLLSNIRFFCSSYRHRMQHLVRDICTEFAQQQIGYYSRIQHLFALLFVEVFREINQCNQQKYSIKGPVVGPENRNSMIERFFELNYHYKARAQDLCRQMNISKSQMNRILKEKYGMTFKQKHVESQIEHAKDMLLNTDWPIVRIAEEFGYTSISGFSTFFKHVVGMSPRAFRKMTGCCLYDASS